MILTLARVCANLTAVPPSSTLIISHAHATAETRGNVEIENFMTTTHVSAGLHVNILSNGTLNQKSVCATQITMSIAKRVKYTTMTPADVCARRPAHRPTNWTRTHVNAYAIKSA